LLSTSARLRVGGRAEEGRPSGRRSSEDAALA